MTKKRRILTSAMAIILVAALLLGLGSTLLMALAADAATVKNELDGLQEQAEEIGRKKEELQAEIAASKDETKSVVQRKSEIDRSMELTRQEIENTGAQIQEYNKLIAAKQGELDVLLAQEAERTEQYQIRLRAMEKAGTKVSYWEILFNASSFTDLLDRINMIQEIEESDQRMLRNMKESAVKIAESREDLAAEKVALEEKKEELAAAEQTLDEQRAEADALLIELSEAISGMEDEISEYEAMEDELTAQIAAKEQEYQNAINQPDPPSNNGGSGNGGSTGGGSTGGGSSSSGSFLYPLPAGCSFVSCAYGYRIHPVTGNYSFHTGVDLAAAFGTPIYATKSGTVTEATYTYVFGNYVTINHGDGFSSLYGHMTYSVVSPGEYVSQGQIIGYVGSTGWSTGAHLHFTLYYNGATVNPMDYVSVQ